MQCIAAWPQTGGAEPKGMISLWGLWPMQQLAPLPIHNDRMVLREEEDFECMFLGLHLILCFPSTHPPSPHSFTPSPFLLPHSVSPGHHDVSGYVLPCIFSMIIYLTITLPTVNWNNEQEYILLPIGICHGNGKSNIVTYSFPSNCKWNGRKEGGRSSQEWDIMYLKLHQSLN